MDVTVPGIIGIENVIATDTGADVIEAQVVADPVDIVKLIKEIQEVDSAEIKDRNNIERAIYHCLGLDTGIGRANKYEFDTPMDGAYIEENDNDGEYDDGELVEEY